MSDVRLDSVSGVLKVIQQFAFRKGTWGPRELARTIGLSKSTTLRILQTLVGDNFLITSENGGQYEMGPELWRLGLGLRDNTSLSTVVLPILRKYVRQINETLHFFRYVQGSIIFDQIVECTHEVRYHVTPGVPYEIEKGAAGKVLLAFLPSGETKKIVRKLKNNCTVNVDELLKKVKETKEKGYSFTIDERGSGVVGFGAPIFGLDKALLGGIGLAIPMARYKPEDHRRYADVMKTCAEEASFCTDPNMEKGLTKTGEKAG